MTASNAQPYDFRKKLDVLSAIVDRAKAELSEDQRIAIQSACRNLRFANISQFQPFCTEKVHQMTLQELSDLGVNDPGVQQIDPKAIERLLFGDYGMITHKKLANKKDLGKIGERPVVVYFQPDPDIEPDHPANASGRHRNYAWQMLLTAAGVSWDDAMDQPMWVDKTIARNKEDFAMMMTLANGQQARRQSPAELKSFDLTKRGIRIEDKSNLVATRIQATQGQYGDVIATGVLMSLTSDRTTQAPFIWDRVKTAWTKAARISPNHKTLMVATFKDDGTRISSLMTTLSQDVGGILDTEAERTSSKSMRERVNESICDAICKFFELPINHWETSEEKAARALQDLQARQEQMKQFIEA